MNVKFMDVINENEKMLFLHQNIVNLVNQLQIPLVEVSLVVAKYTEKLTNRLNEVAIEHDEKLLEIYSKPWPLEINNSQSSEIKFELDKLMGILDNDRIDILDTLIRTSINLEEITLSDSLLVLRAWEKLVRTQLGNSKSPGELFSTVEIPEDF
ncbi:MAG: hypothetical protein CMB56_000635 [Methanobacteriota archaeon]|nr:MAG: hypothetical protein CMB56_000635 [Euryarchaeota archaeon]|tara:strand:- start:608 stop:1069 length:462 start_codon:yes stop_codon:yes gene_type:complete